MLDEVLAYDPNSVEAVRVLVGYDLFTKHPDKALDRVRCKLPGVPPTAVCTYLLAELQIQSHSLDQAAASSKRAMELNSR